MVSFRYSFSYVVHAVWRKRRSPLRESRMKLRGARLETEAGIGDDVTGEVAGGVDRLRSWPPSHARIK